MVNPLARARGHGSAKTGVHHWYAQRASAVLLVFLVGWLVYSIFTLAGTGHAEAVDFISSPINAAFLILLLLTLFFHAMLGLQVVIEDYVHQPAVEVTLLLLTRAGAYIGMTIGVIYVLKLAIGD
ncbi:MAG: succinate dehydrogenase, hydrophobic membrane anchor protein [Xanthomonadales bacterium]